MGDVVVHYANGFIRALSGVTEHGHEAQRPEGFPGDNWQNDGYSASMTYFELEKPIALHEIDAN